MKKTVELTEEELRWLEQTREQKAREEAAAKAEEERKAARRGLEAKFREAMEVGQVEIDRHLEAASRELDLAVAAAEKHGVPFRSSLSELRSRRYVPASFRSKWADADQGVIQDILEDFDIWVGTRESGWEYWNTSSLTC